MLTAKRCIAAVARRFAPAFLVGLACALAGAAAAQIGRRDEPPPSAPPSPPPGNTPSGKRTPPPRPKIIKTPTGVAMPLGRPAEFYFEEGNELFGKEDFASAKMFFEQGAKAARAKSELAEALQRRREAATHMDAGAQLEQKGNFSEALAEYDKALSIEPNNPVAKKHAGRTLRMVGTAALLTQDWSAAIGHLERSRELAPDPATDEALVSALLGLAAGQTDPVQAQATYQRVLTLAPSREEARRGLRRTESVIRVRRAEEAFAAGRYNEARREYEEALNLDADNAAAAAGKVKAEAYLARAAADEAYRARNFRAAYADYRKFNDAAPGDPEVAARLEELAVRLEPALPLRGMLTYKLKTASPFRIRLHRDRVESALLDSENPIEPQIKLDGRLPARDCIFRLGKSSPNVTVRITAMPSSANDYAAELVATPKNPRTEEVTVVAEWALPLKGALQWRKQLEPGAYRVYWQGPYFEVFDPTGVRIESGMQTPLPRQPVTVKVNVNPVKGVTTQVVAQPTAENDFAFVLNVAVTNPTTLALNLSWDVGGKR